MKIFFTRNLAALAAFLVVVVSPAFCFTYSPTQVSEKRIFSRCVTQPSEEAIKSLTADPSISGGTELVVLNSDGKRVSSLRGVLSLPLGENSEDIERSAKSWLYDHAQLFNLPNQRSDEVVQLKCVREANATHLVYGMSVNGIPVHESLIDVHIGNDRRVMLANGSFPTIREVTNQMTMEKETAIAAGERLLNGKGYRGKALADLVIFPEKSGTARVGWLVRLPLVQPLGDWELVIDAETGAELSRRNQMMFSTRENPKDPKDPKDPEKPNGRGAVYLKHPLVSSVTVELLYHLASQSLEGPFAKVCNESGPVACSPENTHVYAPDDTHFDEVNIYYHMNVMHDFYRSMGFKRLDYPMDAIVHYGTKFDNAGFSPMTNTIFFGDGNKFNSLAKEESICYHEYSHAALQAIISIPYWSEAGAINEGQADYFACSFSQDPILGEYVVQKAGLPWLRNLTDNLHYPEDIKNEVHADGAIWGVILWDLRTALGASIADLLIHKSFFFIKASSPKFLDGMNGILVADESLYAGAHKTAILEVFGKRGVSKAAEGAAFTGKELLTMISFDKLHEKAIVNRSKSTR
ncbi:MAG: M36 family metallopeptidase [Candidatus Ozemobacteraceae bacterium]